MAGNPRCGVCEGKTVRIPIPPDEAEPRYSYRLPGEPATTCHVVGKVKDVTPLFLQRFHNLGITLVEVVPVQFGCTGKCYDHQDKNGDPQPSIMTFWMRTDGKEGDLYREMMERQHGHGMPIADSIPGTLKEIVG